MDILIVGGGLTGSVLALNAIKMGLNITLLDNSPEHVRVSEVAAGIVNPVLTARNKMAWMAEKIYPEVKPHYGSLFQYFNMDLNMFQSLPIKYIFGSHSELNTWSSGDIDAMVQNVDSRHFENSDYYTPFGYATIRYCGYLRVTRFLTETKAILTSAGKFVKSEFHSGNLSKFGDRWKYNEIMYDKVVFCQGNHAATNHFTSYIPFKPVKGDVLTIRCSGAVNDCIVQKGVFMLPLDNEEYMVGSTFNWSELNNIPENSGKVELEKRLREFYRGQYEILQHRAGLRPSSLDRRPIAGSVRDEDNMFVLNGLGTKAVALLPYCCNQLLNYMVKGENLNSEINVKRYASHT